MPHSDARRIKKIFSNPRLIGVVVMGFIIFVLLINILIKREVKKIQPMVSPSATQTTSLAPPRTQGDQPKSDFSVTKDTAAQGVSTGSPRSSEASKEIIYELPLNEKILIQ